MENDIHSINDFKNKVNKKLSIIFSLLPKIIDGYQNNIGPIKSVNEFKKVAFSEFLLIGSNRIFEVVSKQLNEFEKTLFASYQNDLKELATTYYSIMDNVLDSKDKLSIQAMFLLATIDFSYKSIDLNFFNSPVDIDQLTANNLSIVDFIHNTFYTTLLENHCPKDFDELEVYKLTLILYCILLFQYAIVSMVQTKNYELTIFSLKQITQTKHFLANSNQKQLKEFINSFFSKAGQKGGITKAKNRQPTRQKILAYHDERFAERKENGKFLHSHAETARLIIKHLNIKGYEPNTLANIIAQHRKSHFTP